MRSDERRRKREFEDAKVRMNECDNGERRGFVIYNGFLGWVLISQIWSNLEQKKKGRNADMERRGNVLMFFFSKFDLV